MSNSYSAVVKQAIDLISCLDKSEYQQSLPPHFPSSIGAHMRHIVDHFLALMNGWQNGEVDYNLRHRENEVEKEPFEALEALNKINDWLLALLPADLDAKLSITSEIDVSRTHSTTCQSTLERELVFVSSHAIHHYALIRIICSMKNKAIPQYFGYAPATITHLNKSA